MGRYVLSRSKCPGAPPFRGITNLKGIAAGSAWGDMFFRGENVIQRLPPGTAGQYCKTNGAGADPVWADMPGGRFERLFNLAPPPVPTVLCSTITAVIGGFTDSHNLAMMTVPTIGMAAAQATIAPVGDSHNLAMTVPTIGMAAAQATIAPVGGGVAHLNTGSIDTDETVQTNNATANDMDLLPAAGNSIGDGFYFGAAALWDGLAVRVGTAGAGTYTITWKYWNGATWVALTVKNDDTNAWKTAAAYALHMTFARAGDWATSTIAGIANLYWIKAEVTMGTMTIQPKGTQAWILSY